MVRPTLGFKGPLSVVVSFFFDFSHFPFSTVSRAEGGGGLARTATSSRCQKTQGLSIILGTDADDRAPSLL